MRAFLALPVPEALAIPLLSIQSRIRSGRPVEEEDLHLTVAFLDEQPHGALEALHEGLEARRLPACEIVPQALAIFGPKRPRLLALDCARTAPLGALHDAARSAAREAGIDLPRARFRPHVTLVRFGALAPDETARIAAALAQIPDAALPDPVPAPPLTLYSSTLTPAGPIYEALAEYELR